MPVTIHPQDRTGLTNKHSLFKLMRRTLQLNDCLISRTRVTLPGTLLLSQWLVLRKKPELCLPTAQAEQLGQSLLPAAQTLSTHGWPCDHLAIAALYQGCFRKAISKLIFLEARSLITWLEMSPAFQPELPAKQPPPRAGMNRNRPS